MRCGAAVPASWIEVISTAHKVDGLHLHEPGAEQQLVARNIRSTSRKPTYP
jgi:hypothetical protein